MHISLDIHNNSLDAEYALDDDQKPEEEEDTCITVPVNTTYTLLIKLFCQQPGSITMD